MTVGNPTEDSILGPRAFGWDDPARPIHLYEIPRFAELSAGEQNEVHVKYLTRMYPGVLDRLMARSLLNDRCEMTIDFPPPPEEYCWFPDE